MNLLPKEFLPLILTFAPLFSKPVWKSALVLLVGAILAFGKRTVSAMRASDGVAAEATFSELSSGAQSCCMVKSSCESAFIPAACGCLCSRWSVSDGY